MAKIDPNTLPDFLLRALTISDYDKGKAKYSATGLIAPPQSRVLQARYPEKCAQEPWDRLYALLGTAIHSIMERAVVDQGHRFIAEKRLFTEEMGVTLSGCPDLVDLDDLTLYDYKSTSVWAHGHEAKREWVLQTNIYAWMLRRVADIHVDAIRIIAFYRDWRKTQAGGENYPSIPLEVHDIEVLDHYEVEGYVRERIALHEYAETCADEDLPTCTPEERWMQPGKWGVQRKGADKPWRTFTDEADARAFIDNMRPATAANYEVVEIPPCPTRCAFAYCPAASICRQYQEELAAAREGE